MALNHLNEKYADLESLGPCSSVLAALRTLQHKGPQFLKFLRIGILVTGIEMIGHPNFPLHFEFTLVLLK